jgi:hypothetical protein
MPASTHDSAHALTCCLLQYWADTKADGTVDYYCTKLKYGYGEEQGVRHTTHCLHMPARNCLHMWCCWGLPDMCSMDQADQAVQ